LTKTKLKTWFVAVLRQFPSVDPLETRNLEIKNTFTSLNWISQKGLEAS